MKRKLSILIVSALCVLMLYSCSKQTATQFQADITGSYEVNNEKENTKQTKVETSNNSANISNEENTDVADKNEDDTKVNDQTVASLAKTEENISEIQNGEGENQSGHVEVITDYDEYPFTEAVSMGDLIAEIEIIEQIKEVGLPELFSQTLFKAKLKKVYKSKVNLKTNEIILAQDGSIEAPVNGGRIFQPGDRAILIMMKSENNENRYWIRSSNAGIYDIVVCDGKEYVVKRVSGDPELKDIEVSENEKRNIKAFMVQNIKQKNEKIIGIQPFLLENFDKKLTETISNK